MYNMGAIRDLHMSPQIFFKKSWECVVFRYLTIPHSTTSSPHPRLSSLMNWR